MMIRHRERFATLVLLACAGAIMPQCHGDPRQERLAAAALSQRFDAVAFTEPELLYRYDPHDNNSLEFDSDSDMRFPFLELLGGLTGASPDIVSELETDSSAVLVGARDFVGPAGIGMVRSRKCYIAVLKSGKSVSLESDLPRKAQVSHQMFGRTQAFTWSMPSYEGHPGTTTFYATQIGVSFFVVANDPDDFQAIVSSLISEDPQPELVGGLRWSSLSTHKYWAFRSFQNTSRTDRSTGSSGSVIAGVTNFTFFTDFDNGKGFLQVLRSDRAGIAPPKILSSAAQEDWIKIGEDGIWESKIPLLKSEAPGDPLFEVFYILGFGLVL